MQNYFDQQSGPHFAFDFDYFRLPRQKWALMLTRLKQMGANIMSLTLPWGFHELERGTLDLTGKTSPRRDVVGLLSMCSTFDLVCMLQVGPFTNSGVIGQGLPAWLLKKPHDLETLLPTATSSWYTGLSHVLADQQWPKGPIIALRHNRASARGWLPGQSKSHLTEVKWPIWLRKRYQGIAALNEAYDTHFRTVSAVTFPQTWANAETPIERDAKQFLQELEAEIEAADSHVLTTAGWQIPLYAALSDIPPGLPAIRSLSLTAEDELDTVVSGTANTAENTILHLQQPIEVDPDQVEIGSGPVWAERAPIRSDGSVRQKFWRIRRALWPGLIPGSTVEGDELTAISGGNVLISGGNDTVLTIKTTARTKTPVYRLRLNGELIVDSGLKVARKRLSGQYDAEDDVSQTDLALLLDDRTAPLGSFILNYLRGLLAAQAEALAHTALKAETLGHILSLPPTEAAIPAEAADHPLKTSYILSEAQRGLREADAALKKAVESISQLENGFSNILETEKSQETRPAPEPVAISPLAFHGAAREILAKIGTTCTEVAHLLKTAATTLQQEQATQAPHDFSFEQYQQRYSRAVKAAQAARKPLLEIIAQLRLQIAAEQLPLVTWRVHDQVQAIADSLRWGVLRG